MEAEKQLYPIRIRIVSSGPSFAMWMLAMVAMFLATGFAAAGSWKFFAAASLWAVCCSIRSNGL